MLRPWFLALLPQLQCPHMWSPQLPPHMLPCHLWALNLLRSLPLHLWIGLLAGEWSISLGCLPGFSTYPFSSANLVPRRRSIVLPMWMLFLLSFVSIASQLVSLVCSLWQKASLCLPMCISCFFLSFLVVKKGFVGSRQAHPCVSPPALPLDLSLDLPSNSPPSCSSSCPSSLKPDILPLGLLPDGIFGAPSIASVMAMCSEAIHCQCYGHVL